ncbi:MAG: prolyl oligopeptidase family serine peptidase [Candidatus Krumholzibacteria bacterium]|nr:prolyl oligopeptidase family serine peptidase [Candidatus Krumholzibacteria bacterium]
MFAVDTGSARWWQLRLAAALVAVLFVSVTLVTGAPTEAAAKGYDYPKARKADVVDDFHGTKVKDPYRWMEDPEAEETLRWVEEQNKLFQGYIEGVSSREAIEKRLTELWDYPKYSLPAKHGNRYFFTKNDGLQNQSVLYVQESLDGEAKVVLDPNKLSEDGTVALRAQTYSHDGKFLAYGLTQSGSDWQEIHVRDVDTGEDFEDAIEWCKFSGIAWKTDNSGFYYNRLPEPGSVPEEDQSNYSRVYWHTLGTPQSEDKLVYEDPQNKELGFYPFSTDDGKYLVIYVYHGTDDRNGLYIRRMDDEGEFQRLVDVGEAEFNPIDNIGSVFYLGTDLDAPRGRIIAVDIKKPDRKDWKEIVTQTDDVIDFSAMVDNKLVVAYMRNANHLLNIYDRKGKRVREVELPTIGSIAGLSGEREDKEMFFGFTSFLYPYTAFHYEFKDNKLSVFRQPEINFDPTKFETKQAFASSKDGTKVPIFITHKKGLKLDGNNPTILYGYGGFNIGLTPSFSITRLVWMESGGIYVLANLRGGDEYGEEWHKAGMLENKQNVFDDFIGAAEWLIENKYTSSAKLAIEGGSNGGLLVAACMLQRPNLFGAISCRVPVTDMLRYHKFTVGRYWTPEYGNAEKNPEHFEFMYAYSPLHNVKEGAEYPPTLITTADTDDRVVPLHAKKFAATLQAADAGKNPILIRIETKAGHGAGKPTSKRIEEAADIYAFLFKVFAMSATMVGQN